MLHHEFRKGQKIFIITTQPGNNKIFDKYVEATSKYLILENNKIEWKNIRSSTIWRGR